MRISYIAAHNIKGFAEEFHYDPGSVNVVSGSNGSNKTSLLSLITGLLGPANPRMLRVGSEAGEIQAVIVDDDSGEKFDIVRQFVPGKAKSPTVKSSKTGKLGAGPTFLKGILDSVSLDPLGEAMHAKEDRQCEILLQTMPLDLDHAELAAAVTGVEIAQEALGRAAKLQALDAIAVVHDTIFAERTGVNRDAKNSATLAEQLIAAIPESISGTDWVAEADRLQVELDGITARDTAKRQEVFAEFVKVKATATQTHFDTVKGINDDIDTAIKALEKERSERILKAKNDETATLERLSDVHREILDGINDEFTPERAKVTTALGEAKANASVGQQVTANRATAKKAADDAARFASQSLAMTKAIENLDKLRASLLDKLPIKGLTIQSGIPYLNGVPLSEANTAEQIKFWVRVAALRAGELGIVALDNTEALDSKNFKLFIEAALKTDIQWFVGRVSDGPFNIEVHNAAVEVAR